MGPPKPSAVEPLRPVRFGPSIYDRATQVPSLTPGCLLAGVVIVTTLGEFIAALDEFGIGKPGGAR